MLKKLFVVLLFIGVSFAQHNHNDHDHSLSHNEHGEEYISCLLYTSDAADES